MARRREEPARAPTLSPAPERRAERLEAEKPPAKRAEAQTIRAIVVDPQAKTVKEIRLKTEPGDERNGYGRQIAEGAAEKIVGVDDLEALDLASGDVVVIDPLRQSETAETWHLGDGEPVVGVGIVVAYDPDADEYSDARLTLDEARKAVTWGDEDDEGARAEVLSAIVDRVEALDTAQLKKLQAMLDELEGADAGDDSSGDARVEAALAAGRSNSMR